MILPASLAELFDCRRRLLVAGHTVIENFRNRVVGNDAQRLFERGKGIELLRVRVGMFAL